MKTFIRFLLYGVIILLGGAMLYLVARVWLGVEAAWSSCLQASVLLWLFSWGFLFLYGVLRGVDKA